LRIAFPAARLVTRRPTRLVIFWNYHWKKP